MSIKVESVKPKVFQAYIKIYEVELRKGLKSKVSIYNDDNELISTENVVIENDDYNNWVNDDELEDLILSKCGLVKNKPAPVVIEEENKEKPVENKEEVVENKEEKKEEPVENKEEVVENKEEE